MFSFFTLKINAFHTVFGVTESLSIGVTHIYFPSTSQITEATVKLCSNSLSRSKFCGCGAFKGLLKL
jgi:hypothetical protein